MNPSASAITGADAVAASKLIPARRRLSKGLAVTIDNATLDLSSLLDVTASGRDRRVVAPASASSVAPAGQQNCAALAVTPKRVLDGNEPQSKRPRPWTKESYIKY